MGGEMSDLGALAMALHLAGLLRGSRWDGWEFRISCLPRLTSDWIRAEVLRDLAAMAEDARRAEPPAIRGRKR